MVTAGDNQADPMSAVATVTLGQPSLTTRVKNDLRDELAVVAADDSVRAVVLTGTGKTFCVGQDLAEHAEALRVDADAAFATIHEHYNPIVTLLATMPKPVIAAINGTCVGAGMGFALACDLRVIARTARFGTAFTKIGLTCDSGLSASLSRAVGSARANELILLGEPFTAEQAVDWGIAGSLVDPDDVHSAANRLAAHLATGPTLAYAEAKRAAAAEWARVLETEAQAQVRLGRTSDHHSAVEAFSTKQVPTFHAR